MHIIHGFVILESLVAPHVTKNTLSPKRHSPPQGYLDFIYSIVVSIQKSVLATILYTMLILTSGSFQTIREACSLILLSFLMELLIVPL
jgi:hypothetical protein